MKSVDDLAADLVDADDEDWGLAAEARKYERQLRNMPKKEAFHDKGSRDFAGKKRKQFNRVTLSKKEPQSARALQGWFSHSTSLEIGNKEQERRDKAMTALRVPADDSLLIINLPRRRSLNESRALALNVNTAGGYLVPESFSNAVENALILTDPIRRVARSITTDNGRPLPWPTTNDVTNAADIIPESLGLSEFSPDIGNIGSIVLGAYKWRTKQIIFPSELLEDAPAEMFMTWLGEILGQRIALGQTRDFTNGSGTGAPLGLLSAATKGPTAGSPTAIAWDDIINLYHSVDPRFRMPDMRPTFFMSDTVLQSLHLLKDTTSGTPGRYLSWASTATGDGWRILNCPVMPVLNMPTTIASGTKSVLFGAAEKLLIRDVRELRVRKLVERFAELDQISVVGLMRSDIAILDVGSHPWKYLQH